MYKLSAHLSGIKAVPLHSGTLKECQDAMMQLGGVLRRKRGWMQSSLGEYSAGFYLPGKGEIVFFIHPVELVEDAEITAGVLAGAAEALVKEVRK
jgi:hypothetical protein